MLEVRIQCCWLHISPGRYSVVILFVFVMSNDKVTDHVASSILNEALICPEKVGSRKPIKFPEYVLFV